MAKQGTILLNLISSLTPVKVKAILHCFDDPDELMRCTDRQLSGVSLLSAKDRRNILQTRDQGLVQQEQQQAQESDIAIIDVFDQHYPALLKEISCPPLVLYVKGASSNLSQLSIAVVGSRTPTLYGQKMARYFAGTLAQRQVVVVSGLARGIDTCAHQTALQAGKTVAVLGSGLLNVYPHENKRLCQKIIERGSTVVSEFGLWQGPMRYNFPRRNRIIAGLSQAVIVVEAAQRSGALITAHIACEQNREVFAVPGPADSPMSRGTNALLKEGAYVAESIDDVIAAVPLPDISAEQELVLEEHERQVFRLITGKEMWLEQIVSQSSLSHQDIAKVLLSLQLKGLIQEVKPTCFMSKNVLKME